MLATLYLTAAPMVTHTYFGPSHMARKRIDITLRITVCEGGYCTCIFNILGFVNKTGKGGFCISTYVFLRFLRTSLSTHF